MTSGDRRYRACVWLRSVADSVAESGVSAFGYYEGDEGAIFREGPRSGKFLVSFWVFFLFSFFFFFFFGGFRDAPSAYLHLSALVSDPELDLKQKLLFTNLKGKQTNKHPLAEVINSVTLAKSPLFFLEHILCFHLRPHTAGLASGTRP